MCTHTTTHHIPCNCISTRTTVPCTEAQGAGYRGSLCPDYEHVQLFIDADDPATCSRHSKRKEVRMKSGSFGRKEGMKVRVKAGVVKEIVRKINGMEVKRGSRLEETGQKIELASDQEGTAKKVDAENSQEVMARKMDETRDQEEMGKKIENSTSQQGMVEQHIENLINHLHRLSPAPQQTPCKPIAHATTKSKPSQQSPPQLNLNTKPTIPRAGTTIPSSIYSDSDYDAYDLESTLARLSPTPQSTPFKPASQASTKSNPPQTPPHRNFANKPTPYHLPSPDSVSSCYSFQHSNTSSFSNSEPFYITTPTTPPTPLTPQTSFQSPNIIYGGTSLLNVPIDGTKWNWDGAQWIGTPAAPSRAVSMEDGDEEEEEFAFRRIRNGA